MHIFPGRPQRSAAAMATILGLSIVAVLNGADDLRIVAPVATANHAIGSPDNRIAHNFQLVRIAQGSDPLENPSGPITQFGLLADGTKTEPDENTYIEFEHSLPGPDPKTHYGHHFLFQGHENGSPRAYITRINLDVTDPAHRITLLTPSDPVTGNTGFGSIDGSTWNPFTNRLLFTEERGGSPSAGRVLELNPEVWPNPVRTLECVIGKAGWEGVHLDDDGNLLMVEDTGGTSLAIDPADQGDATKRVAKQPNSFVYRFVPHNRWNLADGGTLYALQVWIHGAPIEFHAGDPRGDTFTSVPQLKLREPHSSWIATWVPVHTAAPVTDFSTCAAHSFDANAEAKAGHATPFKRPENAAYQPGSRFDTFAFDETGDTDLRAGDDPELAARGAWGSIFLVNFPSGNPYGTIRIKVVGDEQHASFDNLAFADEETLLATEDRGDLLHDQLDRLDSVWAFDVVDHDFGPRRLIALGRDPLATPATAEDNEPTGLFISDGSTSPHDVLGKHDPSREGRRRVRRFVTEQHGMNQVFEILPKN